MTFIIPLLPTQVYSDWSVLVVFKKVRLEIRLKEFMIISVISMSFMEVERTEPSDTLIHVMVRPGIPKASQAN